MAYLVIREPAKSPVRHLLAGTTTVGRAWDCDICLYDLALSRRHCCVEPTDPNHSTWAVVDLHSSNGTRIRDQRISRRILSDGEIIRIGHAEIQFHAAGFVSERPASPDAQSSSANTETPPAAGSLDLEIIEPRRRLPNVLDPHRSADLMKEAELAARWKLLNQPEALPFQRTPPRPIVYEPTLDLESNPPRNRKRALLAGAALAAASVAAWAAWLLWR